MPSFTSITRLARRASALAMTLAMLAPALVGPAPARADEQNVRDHRDPIARLEVVINSVHVFDDNDWGEGDILIGTYLQQLGQCPGSPPDPSLPCNPILFSSKAKFGADDGDTVTLDRVIPEAGDAVTDPSVGPGIGFPIHAGQSYRLRIYGFEQDEVTFLDTLGHIDIDLNPQNGWGIGPYSRRAVVCGEYDTGPNTACEEGDFSVDFEVRRTALPELRPTAFRVAEDGAGDRDDRVCFTVQNRGALPSSPFVANLGLVGAPTLVTNLGSAGLAAGESREQCTSARLPDSGLHQMAVTVDPADAIAEMDDSNNELIVGLDRTPAGQTRPSGGPGTATTGNGGAGSTGTGGTGQSGDGPIILIPTIPQPTPTVVTRATPAGLSVGAIKLNGQAPDVKGACKDGKNTVAVVVKNGGTTPSGSTAARLVVDGADAGQVTVPGLHAGQEREIRFEDVRLKKGEHRLQVAVDAADGSAEANKESTGRTVTVTCQGAA